VRRVKRMAGRSQTRRNGMGPRGAADVWFMIIKDRYVVRCTISMDSHQHLSSNQLSNGFTSEDPSAAEPANATFEPVQGFS
jgi:hypothetical protein